MSEENISGKKLEKITGATDLSTAIKNLERKKETMENEFKEEAHNFFENLNPLNLLNRTLESVKRSSSSNYSLFKESLAFGAGYLSKGRLIRQFLHAMVNTFGIHVHSDNDNIPLAMDNWRDVGQDDFKQKDKKSKEMNLQNQAQIEKVKAKPEILPEPTYWPFFLAMGIAFLGWGLLTTWLISLAGLIILIVALTGWINILRHE